MIILNNFANLLSSIAFFDLASLVGIKAFTLPFSITVLLVAFIYATINLNFIQFTKFKYALKLIFSPEKEIKSKTTNPSSNPEVSSIKTFLSTIAGSTGLGSTAGIAAMIVAGGPGTVFWIPIIVFLQMAFRFIEIYLGHKNRELNDPNNTNGPIKYIRKIFADINLVYVGIFLSFLYAFLMSYGSLIVAMVEINQAVDILNDLVSTPLKQYRFEISLTLSILIAIIIFGGIKRISNFFSFIIPILSIIFIASSLIIVIINYKLIPDAFNLIIQDAFNLKQGVAGIIAGFVVCFRRMCLASETGAGTSAILHANSSEKDSIKEAYQGMISPAVSGLGISFLVGLVIIITKSYENTNLNGVLLVKKAFSSHSNLLSFVITLLFPIMTFNVTIAWSYYSIKSAQIIFGQKIKNLYIMIYIFMSFLGGYIDGFELILKLLDSSIMIIAIINVIAVIIGIKAVKKEIL